jgi:hypothetical protein
MMKREAIDDHAHATSAIYVNSQASQPPLQQRPSLLSMDVPCPAMQVQAPLSRHAGSQSSTSDVPYNKGVLRSPHLDLNRTASGIREPTSCGRLGRSRRRTSLCPATCSRKCNNLSRCTSTRYVARPRVPYHVL